MKRLTIKDVARQAGVSIGTASRVINGAPNVEVENKARVLAAIEALGFLPSRAAQSMRRGSSQEIGIIVRDITTPVLAGFVRAAQTVFEQSGYILLISSADNHKERELELLNKLRRRRIDGLIMTTAAEADPDLTEARRRLDFPVVLFDRDVNGTADCVLVDHAEGIRQATQYLLSLGHRRILLLTGGINTYPARARIEGYKAAHAAVGADIDPALIRTTGFDAITGFRESAAAFEGAQRPTAVIAGGLDMLAGVLKAARARKLRIPQDVSVIGGADSDLAMLATPAVSVVRSDYSELGNACAHLILERIGAAGATTTAPRRIIFPPELVIRDSCAPPADTSAGTTTLA